MRKMTSSFKVAAGKFGINVPLNVAAFATAAALLGTPAQAGGLGRPCASTPRSQWLSVEALQSKVEALGYKVQKAKLKNACGEMYAVDKSGARVELFVDPANGNIAGRL